MELQRGTCVFCTINSKIITPPQGAKVINLVKGLLPHKINAIEFTKLQSTLKVCPSCLHNILEANKIREKIKTLKNDGDSRKCLLCRNERCLLQTTDHIFSLIGSVLENKKVDNKKKSLICIDCYVYLDVLHNLHTKLTYKYPILNADQKSPTKSKTIKTEEPVEKNNGKKNTRSSHRSSKESQKKEKDNKRRSERASKGVTVSITLSSDDENIPEPNVRVKRSGVKTTNLKPILLKKILGHLLPLQSSSYYLQKNLKTDLKLVNQIPYVNLLSDSLPLIDNKTAVTRVNRKRKHDVVESENITDEDIPSPNNKKRSSPSFKRSSPSFFKIKLKSRSSKKKPSVRSPSVMKKIENPITKELVVQIAKMKNMDSSFRTPTKASKKFLPSSSTSDYDTPSSSKKRKSVSFAEEKNIEIEYGEYVPKKLAEDNDETPQKSLKPLLKKSFILEENGINSDNDEDIGTSVSDIIRHLDDEDENNEDSPLEKKKAKKSIRQLDDEDQNNGIVNEDSSLEKKGAKESIEISDSEEDFETEKHERDRKKRFRRNKINILKSSSNSENRSENEDNTEDEMEENEPKDKTNNEHRKRIKDIPESSDEELQGIDKCDDSLVDKDPAEREAESANNVSQDNTEESGSFKIKEKNGHISRKRIKAQSDSSDEDSVEAVVPKEKREKDNSQADEDSYDKDKMHNEENKPDESEDHLKEKEAEINKGNSKATQDLKLDKSKDNDKETKKYRKPGPLSRKLKKKQDLSYDEKAESKDNVDENSENKNENPSKVDQDWELEEKPKESEDENKVTYKSRKPGPLSKKLKRKDKEISSSESIASDKNLVSDSETSREEKNEEKDEYKSKKLKKNEQTNEKDSEDKSSKEPDETENEISKENNVGDKDETTENSATVDLEDLELDTTKEGDDKDIQRESRKSRKPGPLSKKHKKKKVEEKSDGEDDKGHSEKNVISEESMELDAESSIEPNEGDNIAVDQQDKEKSSVRRKPGPLSKKLKRKSREPEVEDDKQYKSSAGGSEGNPKKSTRDNSSSDSDSEIKKSKKSKSDNSDNKNENKPILNDSDHEENIPEVNKYKESEARPRRTSSNDSTSDEFESLIRDKQESLFDRLTKITSPSNGDQGKIDEENKDLDLNKEDSNSKDDIKKSDKDTESAKDKECLTDKDNEIVDVDKDDDSENEKQEDADENECQIVDSKSDLPESIEKEVGNNTVNETVNNEDSSSDCVLVENNLEEPPKDNLDSSLPKTGEGNDQNIIVEDSKVKDGENIEEKSDTDFTDKL